MRCLKSLSAKSEGNDLMASFDILSFKCLDEQDGPSFISSDEIYLRARYYDAHGHYHSQTTPIYSNVDAGHAVWFPVNEGRLNISKPSSESNTSSPTATLRLWNTGP